MSDNYRDVGYASFEIDGGRKPAVLVADFQPAFTDPRYPLGGLPLIHAARDRTTELLEVARARRVPVAACYTAYCSQKDMPLWKVKAVRDEFFYGHPCTEMDPKIHHHGENHNHQKANHLCILFTKNDELLRKDLRTGYASSFSFLAERVSSAPG